VAVKSWLVNQISILYVYRTLGSNGVNADFLEIDWGGSINLSLLVQPMTIRAKPPPNAVKTEIIVHHAKDVEVACPSKVCCLTHVRAEREYSRRVFSA